MRRSDRAPLSMPRWVGVVAMVAVFLATQGAALAHGPHDHACAPRTAADGDGVPCPCVDHDDDAPAPVPDGPEHDCAICKVLGLAASAPTFAGPLPAPSLVRERVAAGRAIVVAASPLLLSLARGPPISTVR